MVTLCYWQRWDLWYHHARAFICSVIADRWRHSHVPFTPNALPGVDVSTRTEPLAVICISFRRQFRFFAYAWVVLHRIVIVYFFLLNILPHTPTIFWLYCTPIYIVASFFLLGKYKYSCNSSFQLMSR